MTDDPIAPGALHSWFLGPRAENAELFERLVTEAVRDHVFWRRNYHPEDGFTIRETDKRTPGYDDAVETLTQELMGLLAELKRDVPFFSGRYKGHMLYEQTIASQIGYFAAMLYNPNNVSLEAAPITTRLELDVAAQLGAMIGYDPTTMWGHLTSGGTVANFEALWIARNIQYLPVAVAGAARELGLSLTVRTPGGTEAPIETLSLFELLNVDNGAALDLWVSLWNAAPHGDVRRIVDRHTLAGMGYQDYGLQLAATYGDSLPPAVVLVPATGHYSWEKILRALGIGSNQLRFVPVDTHFRMDPDALWERLRLLHEKRTPVLGCVTVFGTTEESAVDRIDLVLEVRARAERELGTAFHVHADACYGGYAAAVARRADGGRRTAQEVRASTGTDWPSDGWMRAAAALGGADSVAIDPHKLGYVPYPAGAFLLRDRRARDLVAVDPPYLTPAHGLPQGEELYVGRYIFEGSKPGAAAAAVWLSHKVLPLDERGYGHLIERTVVGARRLHAALRDADLDPYRIVLLPEPDINIVCYLLHHPDTNTLAAVNELNEHIYASMSLGGRTQPEYIITRTRLAPPMYSGAIDPVLDELGVATPSEWEAAGDEGLVVLRSTVMDPFLGSPSGPDHLGGFVAALRRAADRAMAWSRARAADRR